MKKVISLFLCGILANMFLPLNVLAIENVSTEHINLPKKIAKKAPTDIIKTTESNVNITSYNVLPLVFTENFSSKNARVGDEVIFLVKQDLVTKEGSVVIPAGTHIYSEITDLKEPKSFNRCGKVYLTFKEIEQKDGSRKAIDAKLFSQKDFLSRGKLNACGKGIGSVFSTSAVGTAAGCGIGVAAGAVVAGGLAIGLPIGFGVGTLSGVLTPGLYYKAKAGDTINVQLVNDLVLDK